ncbi:pyridoxamine 5'-phosphate oxidase family protein [Streptomyces triticirhizae]|uniref:Pyridoxamine 5'-phosphate oxidase family protein n=1 Tax=Streptomyces triticirhizae TaxID=2483353 RepID=A0A3M2M5I4_9ACTN|nr:pyridoxamine 5'-phosphate oxidase family protein [Streptomyces triticirhizae]
MSEHLAANEAESVATSEAGSAGFSVDAFLARPLTARIATVGPTVRPVWFLWEEGAFWTLTGPWSRLQRHVLADPRVALVVDECDLTSGLVRQVIARGRAELLPFDVPRGRRKLSRYLGPDEGRWDARFIRYLHEDPERSGARWLRLRPERLTAQDLSFQAEPGPEVEGSPA